MSPEEKAVRMALLDCSPEEQEFYRVSMEGLVKDFKDTYESFDDKHKELWVCAISIAINKFAESI